MQSIAGLPMGTPKSIEPMPAVNLDVSSVFDAESDALATRIAQETLTLYPESISRVLLGDGGAFHLKRAIADHLSPVPVEIAPDPDAANVLGSYTMLQIEAARR
jgi:hypothetical protein